MKAAWVPNAKFWICRKFNLKRADDTFPKDREVCEWIANRTGKKVTGKKGRKQMMYDFWIENKAACDVLPAKPPTKRSQRKAAKEAFYTSQAWMELRYQALKIHGAACQCCGASRKDGVVIHVDHIKPRAKYPELALELSNLQVLCEACNLGKLHLDETDWRSTSEGTIQR